MRTRRHRSNPYPFRIRLSRRRSNLYPLLGFGLIGFGLGWLVGMSLVPVIGNLVGQFVALIILLLTVVTGLNNRPSTETGSSPTESSSIESSPSETDSSSPVNPSAASNEISKKSSNHNGRGKNPISQWHLNPWPLAALMVGLFFGTSIGNWVLVNNLLDNEALSNLFSPASPTPTPAAPQTDEELTAKVALWASQGLSQTAVAQRLFDLNYPRSGAFTPVTVGELAAEVAPWVSQGLNQTVVAQRLFDLNYPDDMEPNTASTQSSGSTGSATPGDSATAESPESRSDQSTEFVTGLHTFGTPEGQRECDEIASALSMEELRRIIEGVPDDDGILVNGTENEVLRELFLAMRDAELNVETIKEIVRHLCDV